MISHNLVYPTKHERWIMNLNWGLLRRPPHFESPIYQAQENSQKLWDLKEMVHRPSYNPWTRIKSESGTDYRSDFWLRRVSSTYKFISRFPLNKWTNRSLGHQERVRLDVDLWWWGGGCCVHVTVTEGALLEYGRGCWLCQKNPCKRKLSRI